MRKIWKQLISITLVLAMLLPLVPDAVFAAEAASGTCGENLTWVLTDDGTLTISGTGAMDQWDFEDEVPWMEYAPDVKTLIIDDGVESLSPNAFFGFENLTEVSIPASTTSIDSRAFYYCIRLEGLNVSADNPAYSAVDGVLYSKDGTKLIYCPGGRTQLTISAEVTGLDTYSFKDRFSLQTIDVAEGNPKYSSLDGMMYNKEQTKLIVCPGARETAQVPDTVTELGNSAFYACIKLKEVTLPEGLTTIGNYTFGACENLTRIDLPETVTTMGVNVFESCTGLTEIKLPESITVVPEAAFQFCTGLISVALGSNVTGIADGAFWECSRLETIHLGDKLIGIGAYAFDGCRSIRDITLPDTLTEIGEAAFSGCSALTQVSVPEGVTQISKHAFSGCDSLETVELGNGVTEIGGNAFYFCKSLKRIAFPENLEAIGSYAFYGCDGLTDVYFCGDGIDAWNAISIGTSNEPLTAAALHFHVGGETEYTAPTCTAEGMSVGTCTRCGESYAVTLPKIAHSYGEDDSCTVCGMLRKQSGYCGDDLIWTLEDGVLTISGTGEMYDFYYNEEDLPWHEWRAAITQIVIEEGIATIAPYAFRHCTSVTEVTIPDSVTAAGIFAFADCTALTSANTGGLTMLPNAMFYNCSSLTDVVVGDSVDTISAQTFENCSALAAIEIPDSVTSIGSSAFAYCTALTDVVLPDGLTAIEESTFQGCSALVSISLPVELISIGAYAFHECSSLEVIRMSSTVKRIEEYAFAYCTGLVSVIVYDKDAQLQSLSSDDAYLGEYAFAGCENLESVELPDQMTSIGSSAFRMCGSLTGVTLPACLTEIGDYAFLYCDSLTQIDIPETVTSIGVQAFTCGLTSVSIPASVTVFEDAFYNSDLQTATAACPVISAGAFGSCYELTDVTLQEGVTTIGASAFNLCENLDTIAIPSTVKAVEANAFSGCTGLRKVIYNGTCAQWDEISVANGNEPLTDALIYCTDGYYGIDMSRPPENDNQGTLFEIAEVVVSTQDNYTFDLDYILTNRDVVLKMRLDGDLASTEYLANDSCGNTILFGDIFLYSASGEILDFFACCQYIDGWIYTNKFRLDSYPFAVSTNEELSLVIRGINVGDDGRSATILGETTLMTDKYQKFLFDNMLLNDDEKSTMKSICKDFLGELRTFGLFLNKEMGKAVCHGMSLCVSAANAGALDVEYLMDRPRMEFVERYGLLNRPVFCQKVNHVNELTYLYQLHQFLPSVEKEVDKNKWDINGLLRAIDSYKRGESMMPMVSITYGEYLSTGTAPFSKIPTKSHAVAAYDYMFLDDSTIILDIYDPSQPLVLSTISIHKYGTDNPMVWELDWFGIGVQNAEEDCISYYVPNPNSSLFDDVKPGTSRTLANSETAAAIPYTLVSLSTAELAALEAHEGLEVIPLSLDTDGTNDLLLAWVAGSGSYTLSALEGEISLADDDALYTVESGTSATFQLSDEDAYTVEQVAVSGESVMVSCMYAAQEGTMATVTFEGTPADGEQIELTCQSDENVVRIAGAAEGTVEVAYADETGEATGESWTIELESDLDADISADGTAAPEVEYIPDVACNANTGIAYTTVTEALAEANADETVRLLADCAENQIMVTPGITLDLNGHNMTTDYIVGFRGARVVDNAGGGKLITSQRSVVLDENNGMIPVYDGEGYLFTKAGFAIRQDTAYDGEGVRIDAAAYPVRMDVVELLKDGGADNNVRFVIRLSWDTDEGVGSQEFVFTDAVVSNVYSSNRGTWNSYEKMFSMVITGFENISNLRADMVVMSGTDVEYVSSQSLSIAP